MLKTKFKVVLLVALVSLMLIFNYNISFATEAETVIEPEETVTSEEVPVTDVPTTDVPTTDASTTQEGSAEQDIYEDDLYLFGNSVVMDKLVDGNVYIFANDAEITGQVNGNLYVFANKVKFEGSYIRYSVYVAANSIEFDAACNDLYVVGNTMNVTYDSYIVRDLRAGVQNLKFVGAVGRNANIAATTLSFKNDANEEEGKEEELALIYGDLRYTTPTEIEIPDGVVEGNVSHTLADNSSEEKAVKSVGDYIVSLCSAVILSIVVFFAAMWLTPKFFKKSSEMVSSKMAIGLGIGLAAILVATLITIVLLISNVGAATGFAFFGVYALLVSFGIPVVNICLANKFAGESGIGKKIGFVAIIAAIVWAITQIPVVGGIVSFVITTAGVGTVIYYAFTKNKEEKIEA